ncbi:MAG: 7-cyano-7-deazaguanine synthase QueC [Hyphomicrobiaceae bacterium]
MIESTALVLFSGGQDSTVCLAHALDTHAHVETIGFAYGQRHAIELETRLDVLDRLRTAFPAWAPRLGPDHVLELPTLGRISETSLTRGMAIEMATGGLPNTFVPGRNLLFFTYAAALGYRRGITTLIGGMCETDYSGYPDCRQGTLDALASAISLGTDKDFEIVTPLMHVDKAGTWAMAEHLGGDALVDIIVEATHTCYLGDRETRHAWGCGCGTCPACELRRKGWETWQRARTSAPTS